MFEISIKVIIPAHDSARVSHAPEMINEAANNHSMSEQRIQSSPCSKVTSYQKEKESQPKNTHVK